MDRLDPPLLATADPTTGPTQPTQPGAGPAREPAPASQDVDAAPAAPEQGQHADPAQSEAALSPEPRPVDPEAEEPALHPHALPSEVPSESELPPVDPQADALASHAEAEQGDVSPEPEPPRFDPEADASTSHADLGQNYVSLGPEPPRAETNVPMPDVHAVQREMLLARPRAAWQVDIPASTAATVEAAIAPHPLRASDERPLLADWDRERVKSVGVRAAKVAAIVFSAWFTVVLFLIAAYRFVDPPFSSLMVMQWLGGTPIHRQWVPIERISPNLVRAVIASEDGRFCRHWGIDFAEVAAAIKRTSGGVPRGASTITMQVAKNLFLWPAKSYVRKIVEVPLTYAIEIMWPKRRIMEVYLNIAEWGPGVFGAEAASRAHFGRSASGLSSRQAAQLAVALPNPFVRDAGDPGPWTARRASVIQRRAARSPEEASCILGSD